MKRIVGVFWLLLLMAVPAFATVSVETTRVAYTCNGVLTSYAYPFKVLSDADLLVVKKATATSAETTLTLNTDYTVTGAGTSGGNVVLTAGSKCGSGYTLTILRDMAATQTTDYVDGEAFSAVSIEDALDKVTMIQQQQREQIGRAPKLPETSTITDISLPNPAANNYLGWNAGATGLENKSSPVITTATQYEVDALISYGGGTAYTQATIEAALTAIGTVNKVTLLLRPGTWVISSNADWSAYTNVTLKMPPGAVLSHGAYTIKMPGLVDFPAAQVLSGTGAVTYQPAGSILSEWRGAKADNSTDSYAAIATTFLDAAASKTASFKPTIYFGDGTYLTSSALSCGIGINIIMDGTLSYSGTGNITVLTVGTVSSFNSSVKLILSVTRNTNADWANESAISIKLIHPATSEIYIKKAGNSTIGCQFYAVSASYGCAYNEVRLGYMLNNKVQLDLVGDGSGGWVNENIWIGGRFTVESGVNDGESRYGVRFQSLSTTYNHNNNKFLGPSFELYIANATPGEAVPILMTTGDFNKFYFIRSEDNSNTIIRSAGTSQGNEVEVGYWDNGKDVEDNGTYAGTRLYTLSYDKKKKDALVSVFSSGSLPEKALTSFSGSTYTHIAGMFQATTGDGAIYPALAGAGAKVFLDQYVGFIATETSSALGVVIDTTTAKQFYVHLTTLTSQYARVMVKCYNSTGTLLTSAGAGHPYVKNVISGNNFTYDTTFGGGYLTAAVSSATGFVVGADVKSIRVLVRGEANLQLTGIEILANEPCHVTAGYGESLGESLAYASPTKSLVSVRRHAYHANPAASTTPGWVCVQRLDTTVKVNVAAGTSVDVNIDTANFAAGDVVGIVLDSGTIHWSTVSSITDADTIVIANAVPSLATAGNVIYTMRWKAMADLAA